MKGICEMCGRAVEYHDRGEAKKCLMRYNEQFS